MELSHSAKIVLSAVTNNRKVFLLFQILCSSALSIIALKIICENMKNISFFLSFDNCPKSSFEKHKSIPPSIQNSKREIGFMKVV